MVVDTDLFYRTTNAFTVLVYRWEECAAVHLSWSKITPLLLVAPRYWHRVPLVKLPGIPESCVLSSQDRLALEQAPTFLQLTLQV